MGVWAGAGDAWCTLSCQNILAAGSAGRLCGAASGDWAWCHVVIGAVGGYYICWSLEEEDAKQNMNQLLEAFSGQLMLAVRTRLPRLLLKVQLYAQMHLIQARCNILRDLVPR